MTPLALAALPPWRFLLSGSKLDFGPGEQSGVFEEIGGGAGHGFGGDEHRVEAARAGGARGELVLVAGGGARLADLQPGGDGRDDLGDVAHVGGTRSDAGIRLARRAPERAEVLSAAASERHVVLHVAGAATLSNPDFDVTSEGSRR